MQSIPAQAIGFVTSTHLASGNMLSSSPTESLTAEDGVPAAGYTVSKRLRDSSRKISTDSLTPKGQTPPTG